ncbi:MAG: hypothetical protein NVS2B16_15830 [Chloroflexota bacterium]
MKVSPQTVEESFVQVKSFRTSGYVVTALALTFVLMAPGTARVVSAAPTLHGTWQLVAPQRPTPLFQQSTGIAVDRKHTVYVADPSQGRIVRFSPNGSLIGRWGTDAPGALHWSPRGVATDGDANVYVLAAGITKVSSTGHYLQQWGTSAIQAIAVGGSGNVFALSTEPRDLNKSSSARIDKYSPQGTLLATWHTPALLADSVHQVEANGIALDATGNVYVTVATADNSGRQGPLVTTHLFKFSPAGVLLKTIRPSRVPLGPVQAADARGNLYLALTDYGTSGIEKLSPSGASLGHWLRAPSGQLGSNLHLTLDDRGYLYVADSAEPGGRPAYASTGIIHIVSTSGRQIAQWGRLIRWATLPLGLGITVDSRGTIFATANDQHVFVSISSDGQVVREAGKLSNKPPVMYYSPAAIAVDARGNVYVTDSVGGNVDKLSRDGRLLQQWRIAGINQGPVQGLALDRVGNIYVVVASTIVKISPTGKVLARFGSAGSAPGQFSAPYNLTLDARGNIYVADTHNNRVQEISPSGKLLATWGAPGQLDSPLAVAVGAAGHVFVLDPVHSTVVEFAPNGATIATWGVQGTLTGQLNNPTGLVMGSHGELYVLDYGNNRVQKLVRTNGA